MEGKPLNIRLTDQQHDYLDRLAAAERADIAAKIGGFPPPFTRSDLIRQWIENAARARGFAPPVVSAPVQGVLFPVAAPAPIVSAPPAPEAPAPIVSAPPAPEAPAVAPVQEVATPAAELVKPEAPAPIVSAPPAPEAPVKRRRGKVEPDDVRAALAAALAAGERQKNIAAAAGIDASSMSKFKSGDRPLSEEKLSALAAVLRKLKHA